MGEKGEWSIHTRQHWEVGKRLLQNNHSRGQYWNVGRGIASIIKPIQTHYILVKMCATGYLRHLTVVA